VIRDFPRPGWWGEWQDDRVSIGPNGGPPECVRPRARQRFRGWWLHPRWDDLDLLYFVGYALWNYLSFPRLLEWPGVEPRLVRGGGRGEPALLAVRFPDDLHTHCSQQYFHLDADGHLLRHDYVAEVFGTWAAGANHCTCSETVGGLRLYTRRRVTPSLGRWGSLPLPTLVWINLDDVQVHRAAAPDIRPARTLTGTRFAPESSKAPPGSSTVRSAGQRSFSKGMT
jgi:hypothetical protein